MYYTTDFFKLPIQDAYHTLIGVCKAIWGHKWFFYRFRERNKYIDYDNIRDFYKVTLNNISKDSINNISKDSINNISNLNIDKSNLTDNNLDSNSNKSDLNIINKCRRKFSWFIIEKKSGKFNSYKEFKVQWDPNSNIWNDLNKKINYKIEADLYRFKIQKETLKWFINRSKP